LLIVGASGDLLHVPALAHRAASSAVDAATGAFGRLGRCDDDQISEFFARFASSLRDDEAIERILAANGRDVDLAANAGRSTTRLVLTEQMRQDMIVGLEVWRDSPLRRDAPLERIEHGVWSLEARQAPLGVVGFVFEGRPNVVADAAGVVRTGNTVAMRIGSDALGTAEAIVGHALAPALQAAGLPPGTVALVRSPSRAAGWALFDDVRLALAVARGSGPAVAQLGAVARQAGTPVSVHGTGGAWLVVGESARPERLHAAVVNSLDRKVCNTLNVCCLPRSRPDLVGAFLAAVDEAAARRGTVARLHVDRDSQAAIPEQRFTTIVSVTRADGVHEEPAASIIGREGLAVEWEWEQSPELSLVVVDDVAEAIELCNRYSPRFVASLISEDGDEHDRFYAAVDAPFVGDGFTRWVDGQYALATPELGLSNWQSGRLLARGGVLSGSGVHTVRYRATIRDPDLHR
ncbi:MAG: aldehyde dehydrogenase family protein, partial [Acidimicrobiia bacterium]|nr:aldehyde dehydrogenase family protein [Acidimicrobiia bacterium]